MNTPDYIIIGFFIAAILLAAAGVRTSKAITASLMLLPSRVAMAGITTVSRKAKT